MSPKKSSRFSFSVKSDKDNVTNAGILQALKIVDGNMSFASANGVNQRFKAMSLTVTLQRHIVKVKQS